MSSGGMDWAYRMIAAHKLDALGVAIVLHLGWRDHADFRTDRGIARALGRDRENVRDATARLAAAGVIARRSGQWVACETIAIVCEEKGALRPSPSADDAAVTDLRGSQTSGGHRPPGAGVTDLRQRGSQTSTKRNEKLRNSAAPQIEPVSRLSPAPACQAAAVSDGASRAALAASLGLPVRDKVSGGWLSAGAAFAMNGGA